MTNISGIQQVKLNQGYGNSFNKSDASFKNLVAKMQTNDSKEVTPEIHKAAQEFESMFVSEMLRPIFDSQEVDPEFGGGNSEKIYRSMLVDEYGKAIGKAGGIGLAKNIEQSLLRAQGAK